MTQISLMLSSSVALRWNWQGVCMMWFLTFVYLDVPLQNGKRIKTSGFSHNTRRNVIVIKGDFLFLTCLCTCVLCRLLNQKLGLENTSGIHFGTQGTLMIKSDCFGKTLEM